MGKEKTGGRKDENDGLKDEISLSRKIAGQVLHSLHDSHYGLVDPLGERTFLRAFALSDVLPHNRLDFLQPLTVLFDLPTVLTLQVFRTSSLNLRISSSASASISSKVLDSGKFVKGFPFY
ncbi:MAG: hypothetical protein HY892_21025 [Deltaproteobacteria bacterium]|nr:hypothetical protein [Deltaproteobacteria bacterium]